MLAGGDAGSHGRRKGSRNGMREDRAISNMVAGVVGRRWRGDAGCLVRTEPKRQREDVPRAEGSPADRVAEAMFLSQDEEAVDPPRRHM